MNSHTTYEELLKEIAQKDERIVVMTAENRALIRNLPPVLGNRFIDTGITEQCMIGAAAGLALRGRKPIVHALASFLTMRAFEFIRTDIGISGLPVKLTSFVPGFLSDGNGPTHQAIEDVSLMRGIPGMQVFAPADNEDMLLMLPKIWENESPAYVRANTRAAIYKHAPFEPGKAEVISTGKDLTILVYGMLFEQALGAKKLLEKTGLQVGLANMRSLVPVDETFILETANSSSLIVTLEDHFLTGGLYSIVAEILLKHQVTARVLPIALENRWFKPGLLSEVLEYEGFTANKIADRILAASKPGKFNPFEKIAVTENTFDE
jgi:transketolase